MTFAAGMGSGKLPSDDIQDVTFNLISDADSARRLRDRVAREIAAIVDAKPDNEVEQIAYLIPVFRWLTAIADNES